MVKYTSSSLIDRYKAWIVAGRFTQFHSINYEEKFFLTLQLKSLRILLSFAGYFRFKFEQIDILDAYFKDNLNKTTYIKIL